jgi:hypothetical protein
VQAIGDVLAGTGRPFLLASGVTGLTQGRPAEAGASSAQGPRSPPARRRGSRRADPRHGDLLSWVEDNTLDNTFSDKGDEYWDLYVAQGC